MKNLTGRSNLFGEIKIHMDKHYLLTCFTGGAVLGIICFIMIYGVCSLDVGNIAYIINEGTDLPGQYIAWDAYRYAGWRHGIGLFDTLTYPNTTSYELADTVPILGLFFKTISPILPATFQYVGLWGLLCFLMQGGLAAIIIRKFSKSNILSIILAFPFILASPVLVKLFFHHAEAGQWVLLLTFAIWIYNIDQEHCNLREYFIWGAMGLITSGVCIYFIPMVGMIFIGYSINCVLNNRKNIVSSLISLIAYLGMCILFMAVMGAFASNFTMNNDYYGEYIDRLYRCGANLNAFINSWGISYFGKYFDVAKDGQGEGNAYLGMGMIIAVVVVVSYKIASVYYTRKNNLILSDGQEERTSGDQQLGRNFMIALTIVFIMSVIVGIGPVVSINKRVLCTIPYPSFILRLWCNFRSTGRMIWPAYYCVYIYIYMTLFNLHYFRKEIYRYFVTIFLGVCCVIQIIDLAPYLVYKHKYFAHYQELETTIHDDAWDVLGQKYKHLVVLPNYLVNRSDERHYFGKFATDYDLTLNDFYLARQDLVDQTPIYFANFAQKKFDDDTFYVFSYDKLSSLTQFDLHFYIIDKYIVATEDDISNLINKKEIDKVDVAVLLDEQKVYINNEMDYSPIFNLVYYYYKYPDVYGQFSIMDTEKVFEHFVNVGMKEGRQGAINFSPEVYRKNNPDLYVYGDEWSEYYIHYLTYGINENRKTN